MNPEQLRRWLLQSPEHVIQYIEDGLKGEPGKSISQTFTERLMLAAKTYMENWHA